MKFSRILVLMMVGLLLILPGLAEEDAGNLLYNGGFEWTDEDGLPDGWYTDAYVHQEGYTTYRLSDDARSGAACAVVDNLGMNDARFAQSVAVEPESLYRLSGWIRAEGILDSGLGANLSIEGVYVFSESVYDSQGEWTYIELYGETGEDQREVTVFARVGGYSGESQGKASFDDLRLEKVDALPDDVVAELWFVDRTPVVAPEVPVDGGEASPFWPWLLLISAAYALMAALIGHSISLNRESLRKEPAAPSVLFLAGLLVAAVSRITVALLVEGYPVDVNCFLSWGATVAQEGTWSFYQPDRFCDYTPGYLYVLGFNGLLSRLTGSRAAQVLIYKTLPMLCDLAAACLVERVARREGAGRTAAGLAGLLVAFNPAVFINSAAWCQMDSVFALGLMLVAWLAIRRKWKIVLPLYVLCVLVKPQALMLGFLGLTAIIMAWIRHREDRKPILMGVGFSLLTALAVAVPFTGRQPATWLFDLYAKTLASYPYATVNTANLYYLFHANWVDINALCGWGAPAALAALSLVWGMTALWRGRVKELRLYWLEPALMAVFVLVFLVMSFLPVSWLVAGAVAMALAFAVVLPMLIRSGRVETLPLCGGVLFILLYVLGIKMHERYLFPALLLLGMAYAICRDRRILLLLTAVSCTMFVNEGVVLDNAVRLGASMGHLNSDTNGLNMLLSWLNLACVPLAVWVCHSVCMEDSPGLPAWLKSTHADRPAPSPLNFKPDAKLHWKRMDTFLVLGVTLLYSVVALWNLGSMRAPQNPWKSTASNEAVVVDLGQHYDDTAMLYFAQVSRYDFSVAVSEDGEKWSEEYWAQMDQGQCYRWKYLTPSYVDANGKRSYVSADTLDRVQRLSGRYVRITAQQIGLILNEVIFRDAEGRRIPAVIVDRLNANAESPLLTEPAALLDEQDTIEATPGLYGGAEVTAEPSWYNSTYFDEIYHARTAMEHLRGEVPYETSHPPLGKLLMSVGIAIFGMTPFGWRIAGVLAGIIMLPVMYALGKQLTKRTDMAFAAMTLLALDCMHLGQTRIATIDSFPVLFILLSYLFMLRFMQRDLVAAPLRTLLPELALSGLFMGCGIASKWIGAYAAVGLAVLFFWTCARHLRLSAMSAGILSGPSAARLSAEEREMLVLRDQDTVKRIAIICAWCVLFFVMIPVTIYLLAYIPYFAYAKAESFGDFVKLVIGAQEGMYDYHSTPGLGMDHAFYSPWYEWLGLKRPMYFASAQYMPEGISLAIFCFGSPAVCVAGLGAMVLVAAVWLRRHMDERPGSDALFHWTASTWSINPAFVFIGLLAQLLPWVLVPRGTYMYHYFASIPFLILALVLVLNWLRERWPRTGRMALALYLIFCLATFLCFYPYASGLAVPDAWLDFGSKFLRLYHS